MAEEQKRPGSGDRPERRGSATPQDQAAPAGHEPAQSPQPASKASAAAPGDKATTERPKTPGMVTLTIDGQTVTVPRGTLVVEAAKRVNIEVPVFCYHHKLDPVGACRLCLVEISPGPPKPTTACTTPAAEGMVVRTVMPSATGVVQAVCGLGGPGLISTRQSRQAPTGLSLWW